MNLKSRTFTNLHCFLQVAEHRFLADWHGRLPTKPHFGAIFSVNGVPLDSISVYQIMEKLRVFFCPPGAQRQKRTKGLMKHLHWALLAAAYFTSDRVEKGQLPETAGSDKPEKSPGF